MLSSSFVIIIVLNICIILRLVQNIDSAVITNQNNYNINEHRSDNRDASLLLQHAFHQSKKRNSVRKFLQQQFPNPVFQQAQTEAAGFVDFGDTWTKIMTKIKQQIKRDIQNKKLERQKRHPLWGDWTDWSACSVTCGKGREIRWRHCHKNCGNLEAEMEEKICQLPACPGKLFGLIQL